MLLTGAELVVQALIDQGTDLIFGYPGGKVITIYDALYAKKDKITHILTSHEQGATHAADGYARSTGKTGVVIATSGPGATNLVTGIATAYLDSVPLVAITGNVPLDLIGRDSFQEVDAAGITNPVVKHNYIIQSTDEIEDVIREAFVIANSGRKGPVHIDIPEDLTKLKAEYKHLPRFIPRPDPKPDEKAIEQCCELIKAAERPMILAGGGVVFSDASEALLAFAQKINAPVCTTMMGLSSVPRGLSLNLGMVGMHGTPTANIATNQCDVLIAIGARFSDRVAGNRKLFAKNAKLIHIDIDASEISKNVIAGVSLVASAKDALTELTNRLPEMKHEGWIHEMLRHKALNQLSTGSNQRLNPVQIIKSIQDVFGEDTIVVTDVGQHQMFTAQHYPFIYPRTFISSCGLGTMGYGLGAAIGTKLGNPDKPVVLISGDGSFHMNMNEMAVAVSNNVPVVVLVMNNHVLGMVHQWQTLLYQKRLSNTVIDRKTDYVKLAEAFGGVGFRITQESEIRDVLQKAKDAGRPCIVDCDIDPDERVYPFIPAQGSVEDMIYGDDIN